MLKRRTIAILATILILALCASCAQTGDGTTTTGGTTTDATTAGTTSGTTGEVSAYPDYLNLDSYVPIIKEGQGEDIVLEVTALHSFLTSSENIEELWGWLYTEKFLNIQVNVTALDAENLATRKNLMFASGEETDLMLAMGFTPNEQYNYGLVNGQLLTLDSYLTAELTPDVNACFDAWPIVRQNCTAPDGHIYSLPFVYYGGDEKPSTLDNFTHVRLYLRESWLQECGVENPETLDQMLEMLRAFKEKSSAMDGAYPLGAHYEGYGSSSLLMLYAAANGVVNYGSSIAASLVHGQNEVVLPVLEDWYYDYIGFIKTLYDEGLISPDYFTMDATQLRAINAEGKFGGLCDTAPYLSDTETYLDWCSINALTLNEGETPIAPRGYGSAIGGFCIAANTEYPELCMRFGNYFFTDEGYTLMWAGPLASQTELLLDRVEGRVWSEEKKGFLSIEAERGDYATAYAYNTNAIYLSNQSYGWGKPTLKYHYEVDGIAKPEFFWNLESMDTHYRYICYEATHDDVVDGYPQYVYLDNEATETITDVSSMVEDYIDAEVAKFVTGSRAFTPEQFKSFQDELMGMGMDKYLEIYVNAYKQ